MKRIALYIHIPFCVSKCAYCNFCSFVPKTNQIEKYIEALLKEIGLVSQSVNSEIFSIYVGGGTPSVLPQGDLTNIFDAIYQHFKVLPKVSVTIEANPNSFSLEKAQEYVKCGCNRVSFGLQSADKGLLKVLNRAHDFQDCVNAVNNAKKVGIDDINVDVLLGVPTQTQAILTDTLQKVVSLPITHVSAYGLILEENTALFRQIETVKLTLPSEDETVDMYESTVAFLDKHGFSRYEISNFAKSGFESVHNLNYWDRGEFIGLGLNAYSFINGVHYRNKSDFKSYCENLLAGKLCQVEKEKETLKTKIEETIMLALRTSKGLDIAEFNQKFHVDFEKKYEKVLNKLKKLDLIKLEHGFLVIKNMYVSNSVITEFFE